jgi:tRNA modification GTPase
LDTIVAPASALVTQAVGIVRLSGPQSHQLARLVLAFSDLPEPGRFAFRRITDQNNNEFIDEGLVLVFKAPNSFTGEDAVEFQTHGSPAVLERLTDLLVSLGARLANPGEFSFRAFANGKATLSELETFNALTHSSSHGKGIGESIAQVRSDVMDILASVEASISFPNDEEGNEKTTMSRISDILLQVSMLCDRSNKPGLPKIVLGGPQNAGKSTLFNRLVGFGRTVVSDVPGTTRDYVSAEVVICGKRVEVYDSPGFEDNSDDPGQLLAKKLMDSADVVVWMEPEPNSLDENDNVIKVHSRFNEANTDSDWLQISAQTGIGLDRLYAEIAERLPKPEFLVTPRQKEILQKLRVGLGQALDAPSFDIMSFELNECARILSELDGIGLSHETLSLIFSNFCIGK